MAASRSSSVILNRQKIQRILSPRTAHTIQHFPQHEKLMCFDSLVYLRLTFLWQLSVNKLQNQFNIIPPFTYSNLYLCVGPVGKG